MSKIYAGKPWQRRTPQYGQATGLYETTEATMVAAHKAGAAYWRRNKTYLATHESLACLARSCGWHDEDATAWMAGYLGAQRQDEALAVVLAELNGSN